ncbi:MAG TPA: aminodeoxychorismate synthase component I [Macromonas sp.]|nr:aminodeoxychorismate synthase component I [Macromonas sp.]
MRGRFGAPLRTLVAHTLPEVRSVLQAVQAEAAAGHWCVGYVRYEAAPAFDAALQVHTRDEAAGPLAWFGVHAAPAATASTQPVPGQASAARATWRYPHDAAAFAHDIRTIHAAIAAGELYQVNHTAQAEGELTQGSALDLFAALRQNQPGGYAAYIDSGAEQVLSVSPELFFDWDGERLLSRPMKGTAPRGATPDEDAALAEALRQSPKEQAENVMIVDLIRNDLSRVAQPFSVQVPRLFHLEALPTVWQMTSDVVARTRPGTTLLDVFMALFPCGSVTGAPKVQAMRQIHALEPGPRGVYCGAVGVVRPGLVPGTVAATFNVAIRSVTAQAAALRCGIGSGITADATVDGEWQEWRHKRAFLERASEPFDLLETLALDQGTLRNLERHLARLARAAQHFGYPWDEAHARAVLQGLVQEHAAGLWRVRVLLNAQGELQAQAFAMEPTVGPVKLTLAAQPFAVAHSEFVRFKTTRRAHYDAAAPSTPGVFDTLLWNEAGELTECSRGNIAVQLDGRWLTPPLSSGLLDGIGREVALAEGRLQEAVVRVEDLPRATGLAFLNSLRGWIAAELV